MPSCGVDPGLERRPKGSVSSPTLRVGHAREGKPSNATPRSGGPAGRGSRLHPGQCTPENVTKSGAPDEGSGTARVNPRKEDIVLNHITSRIVQPRQPKVRWERVNSGWTMGKFSDARVMRGRSVVDGRERPLENSHTHR